MSIQGRSEGMSRTDERMRSLMLVYLVGGIAVVLAILWWTYPGTTQIAEPRIGRLEARYRHDASALLQASGVTSGAKNCQYLSKAMALECEVDPNVIVTLRNSLQAAGWSPALSAANEYTFTKAKDLAAVRCTERKSESLCYFSLKFNLTDAAA